MSTSSNLWEKIGRSKDETKLLVYAVLVLGTGVVIGGMVSRAFGGYSPVERTIYRLLTVVPFVDRVTLAAGIFGVYFGLVTLLFIDYKKRIQSLLLLVGTVAATLVLLVQGVLFSFMGAVDFVIAVLVAGAVAVTLGGENLRRLSFDPEDIYRNRVLTNDNDEPVEFPNAATYLHRLLAFFVAVTFVEAQTRYGPLVAIENGALRLNVVAGLSNFRIVQPETTIALDLFVSAVFIGSFGLFLGYEASKRIVFIGPPRSGKTHLLIGLYAEAQGSGYNPRNVSSYLRQEKQNLTRTRTWAGETVAEVNECGFRFSSQGLFSKNIVVDGLDYPGEYMYFIDDGLELANEYGLALPGEPVDITPNVEFRDNADRPYGERLENATPDDERVPTAFRPLVTNKDNGLEGEYIADIRDVRAERTGTETAETNGGQGIVGDDGNLGQEQATPEEVYVHMINSVLPRIRDADLIGFVFDIDEHRKWEDGEPTPNIGLEDYQGISDKVKASHMGIATKSDRLLEEYKQREGEPPRGKPESYDRFRDHVTSFLLSGPNEDLIRSLELQPYPVYIETTDEGGEEQPQLPLSLFGFETLLAKLSE